MIWKAFTIDEIQQMLKGFDRWFIDGGVALDHFLGRSTRVHGDIDIGVLSDDAEALLAAFFERGLEVFDVSKGRIEPVHPPAHREQSYNYWVSDGEYYRVQIFVYKVEADQVQFRRNPAITWPKAEFTVMKGSLRIVNPLVTYAFKVTTQSAEQKDLADVGNLLSLVGAIVSD